MIPLARYGVIEDAMRDQAKEFTDGIACLVILPPDTRPPPDEVKRRVKSLLTGLGPSLSCLAYVIEGTGFKAITVRATLVAMKIFSAERYPIYVDMSLENALNKVLPHLARGKTITRNMNVIVDVISDARSAWQPPPAPRVSDLAPK
ncbi:MAG: hypothetical protein E6J90_33515 [Deltaproteobacteria bacterium]|nr:MAG: hypothetical protein E6J90_33515 [Deltaproteobacteria bacterium]